ncbi:hypothetical protein DFJ58DRAFT_667500 [Suillus subalutaceus]|uniref:uncharacterized protein n=1 Tax=Suillus subalutaceus TaxID=48586 RepID=UPI001B86C03E|nr:uncharacterized protein DFJ58DRAFT_667500 [Suillus subalutaceus]KAG1839818.1 hypothetical protein DFJ58DRAFT_667500 [Suillus subalutaceus]
MDNLDLQLGWDEYISKERKQVALQMSLLNIKDPMIRRYTGISERSLRYLRKAYWETGEVVRTPVITYSQYYIYVISQFLEACIKRQPDILLTEMQDQLRETCGVEVSITTISRMICR